MQKLPTGLAAAPMTIADLMAFSSTVAAAIAALLVSAAGAAMGVAVPTAALGLAAAGTLFVYNVDRLRDLDADRETAPARTAFVERHRAPLRATAGIAALVGMGCAALLPPRAWILCAGGLFGERERVLGAAGGSHVRRL